MVKKSLLAVVAVLSIGALVLRGLPQNQPRLEPVPKAPDKPQKKEQETIFRLPISEVALPVTFLDPAQEFVTDIERPEVTVLDNKMAQRVLTFEVAYKPISMVILIDTSTRVEGTIANVRTAGILFTQLVMGETGEAAVLTYDQTVDVRQPFTTNGDLIEKVFKNLKAEAGQARLTDAVFRGLGMLTNRGEERRKVIVVIGEGRDIGSESKKAQALREAQLANVSIYTVELSAFKSLAGRSLPETRVDPLPPGSRGPTNGVPLGSTAPTPMDLATPAKEIGRAAMALIWNHPMKTYASHTGSDHIEATKSRAIEEAVQRIGRELHSQYWVSYRPNNLRREEFHTIEVKVNRPGIKVRARPGYWYLPASGEATDFEKLPK